MEQEELARLAQEEQEWDMEEQASVRRENEAKFKEMEARRKEEERVQMKQLEEVGYSDNFSTLEGNLLGFCYLLIRSLH